jgi:hypothetical protein
MDPAANPNPPTPLEGGGGSFSGDYWNGMTSLYNSSQTPEQPFGIGWDHPVFQNNSHSQPHTQGQNLYTQSPQGWQQDPLQPPMAPEPQSYAIPGPYRLSPYQHPNPTFNHPQHNAPSYHPYPFDSQSYYPSSAVPPQNGFNQPPTMVMHRSVEHNPAIGPNALPNPLTSYTPPPTLQRDIRVSYLIFFLS